MDERAQATAQDRLAYRISDACTALGIGRTSFNGLVKSGELKLIKIAGRTLVPRSELERLTRVDRNEAA
jgi:predicted site-specific integrase-resolvase